MGWAQPIFFCRRSAPAFFGEHATTWLRTWAICLQRTLPADRVRARRLESTGRGGLVRVFIDKPDGVDVDDCARVSNHLTRLFAVENIDFDRLEVSSPGLDRPLTKLADYERFAGEEVQLTLTAPVDGAKRMKGIVRGTDGGNVKVETAKGMQTLPFGSIGRARLVPENRLEKVMMNRELLLLVDALSREKNVPKEIVFTALEAALASATKKKYADNIDARVSIDRETGDYETFRRWTVVPDEEHEEPAHQIAITDALERDPPTSRWATSSRRRWNRSISAASARRRPSR